MRVDGQTEFEDIVPDGDVILVVGVENRRLRINSQFLRYASKVFRAMFGPDWREGRRISNELPAEVALPNDDADAMRIICCIIHHRNNLIPPLPTTKKVLQIAIVVDKYDLTVALKFVMLEWLRKPRNKLGIVEVGDLLAAAFLLNIHDMLVAYAKMLVLDYSESYRGILDDELIGQVLPASICCM